MILIEVNNIDEPILVHFDNHFYSDKLINNEYLLILKDNLTKDVSYQLVTDMIPENMFRFQFELTDYPIGRYSYYICNPAEFFEPVDYDTLDPAEPVDNTIVDINVNYVPDTLGINYEKIKIYSMGLINIRLTGDGKVFVNPSNDKHKIIFYNE